MKFKLKRNENTEMTELCTDVTTPVEASCYGRDYKYHSLGRGPQHEDGDSMLMRNVNNLIQNCTESQP